VLGGLGTTELVFLSAFLLVFFGGKKLPELARGIGDSVREFRRAVHEA